MILPLRKVGGMVFLPIHFQQRIHIILEIVKIVRELQPLINSIAQRLIVLLGNPAIVSHARAPLTCQSFGHQQRLLQFPIKQCAFIAKTNNRQFSYNCDLALLPSLYSKGKVVILKTHVQVDAPLLRRDLLSLFKCARLRSRVFKNHPPLGLFSRT